MAPGSPQQKNDVLTRIVAPDVIGNYYELCKQIGSGGFATVYHGRRLKRPVLHQCAVKTVKKASKFVSCVLRPDKEEYQAKLLQFDHPNVTSYYDFLEDELYAYVVMPLSTGPSLWDRLKETPSITEKGVQDMMIQILRALSYIHNLGVTHRDVTPDNLIFASPESEVLRLIDFGLCALDALPNEEGSIIGTLLFMPPECFTGEYSTKFDVWSAGINAYMMLSGSFPYAGTTANELLNSISEGVDFCRPPWTTLSAPCNDIVHRMLRPSPTDRWTAAMLLHHEWFQVIRPPTPSASGAAVKGLQITTHQTQQADQLKPVSDSVKRLAVHAMISGDYGPGRSLADPLLPKSYKSEPVKSGFDAAVVRTAAGRSKGLVESGRLAATFFPTSQQIQISATQSHQNRPITDEEHGDIGHGPAPAASMSDWDGTVATFSSIIAAGLLSSPYAFLEAGWVAAPLLIFFTCLSCYTAHLMAWSLNSLAPEADRLAISPCSRTWGFLVGTAFGSRAKSLLNAFLILELWGYVLSYTVVFSVNLNQLVPRLSLMEAIFLGSVVVFALTFASGSFLSKVGVLCNLVFLSICFMFLGTGYVLPERAPTSDQTAIRPSGILAATGILVFNAASHACYPSIMQNLAEPARYTSCLRQSYAAALLFYLMICVPGYFCFGAKTQQSIVQNIGVDLNGQALPNLGWMSTFAAAGMVIKMFSMQPLVLTPLTSIVESLVSGCCNRRLAKFVVAPAILAFTGAIAALFADNTAILINLIGSVLCMNIAFVMPVACYWKLSKEPLGLLKKLWFSCIMLMGAAFAVLGVVTTFS